MGKIARFCGLLAATALVAACGSDDDEPPAQPSPAAADTPSAEPTPEPEAGGEDPTDLLLDLEVPAEIELVDLPAADDLTADEAAALRSYLYFEVYRLTALHSNEVPDDFYRVAGSDMISWVENHVADQESREFRLAGDYTIAYDAVEATGDVATVAVCLDDRDTYATFEDGSTQEVTNPSFTTVTAELNNVGTGWQVTAHEFGEDC
jgi:hypothetical protein